MDHVRDAATRKRRFEELVAGQLDSLYRTALTLTRKPEDAEDVVEAALAKAWRSFDSLREDENPRGWLVTILINTYRDRYKKQKRAPEAVPLEADDLYVYGGAIDAERLGGADPEEVAIAGEMSDPVLQAIRDLPSPFREALLVDLEGFSYQEAAEIMGTLTGTVMSRLHRARKRLGQQLAA